MKGVLRCTGWEHCTRVDIGLPIGNWLSRQIAIASFLQIRCSLPKGERTGDWYPLS
jgi:hypothetical protein